MSVRCLRFERTCYSRLQGQNEYKFCSCRVNFGGFSDPRKRLAPILSPLWTGDVRPIQWPLRGPFITLSCTLVTFSLYLALASLRFFWVTTSNNKPHHFHLLNETNKMHIYCIFFRFMHLHVSVLVTVLRVLTVTEYINVIMCRVQYVSIYNSMM